MRTAAVLAVSAAVHVGLLLALPGPGTPLTHPRTAAVEIEVHPAPDPAPEVDAVAVQYLTLPAAAVAAAAPAPGTEPVAPSSSNNRPSVSTGYPGSTGTGAATEPAGPYTGALSMRNATRSGPKEIVFSLPAGVLDEILNRPPPEQVEPTGRIVENKDGTYTGKDLMFTAHFNPDGTVASLDDKPNFHYKFHIPKPKKIIKGIAHHVSDWTEDPYGVASGMGNRNKKERAPGAVDDVDDEADTVTILSGGFDVTDAIMRMNGEDPYAARKRALLEKTFDERVQIGAAYRAEQLDKADQYMVDNLKKLWARDDLSLADKRALIFALWDECAEDGGEQLVAGGEKARAALYRFVNVHLPAGGDRAFTDDEIAAFNQQRKSHARFAPYE